MLEKTSTIDGHKLHWYTQISNKPKHNIFLVHGWGGTGGSLSELAKLIGADSNLFLIDLPGFGKSDNPPKTWGPYEYAELVGKWISESSKNRLPNSFIGHSFGGGIGAILSAKNPKLVNKLILVSSAIYRDPKINATISKFKKLPFYNKIRDMMKGSKRLFYRIVVPQSDSYKYAELETNFREIISTDLSKNLVKISQKTLILWGDQDKDTPLELGKKLHKEISGSVLKIYAGYGHGLPKKAPEVIAPDIIKFINS